MTSTIKKLTHIGQGTSTGETGITTIQFPKLYRTGYLIWCGDEAFAVGITSATSMIIKQLANGTDEPVVTANGDYNFTISGLPWYSTVYFIGALS